MSDDEPLTPEMKKLKENLEEHQGEKTSTEEIFKGLIPILNATGFEKDRIYVIQLSDTWLDRMAGTTAGLRKIVARKIGSMIVEFLHGYGIHSIVLIGEAVHIYDTEKKSLKEVLNDAGIRESIRQEDRGCEEGEEERTKGDSGKGDGDKGSGSGNGKEEEGVQTDILSRG